MKKMLFLLLCSAFWVQSCTNAVAVSSQGKSPGIYDKRILPIIDSVIQACEQPGAENYYDWNNSCRCNVGLTAQLACNMTEDELFKVKSKKGSWTDYMQEYGGRDLFKRNKGNTDKVMQGMHNAGFTDMDITHLENLSDPRIIQYTGKLQFDNFKDYVRYLRAWRDNSTFR